MFKRQNRILILSLLPRQDRDDEVKDHVRSDKNEKLEIKHPLTKIEASDVQFFILVLNVNICKIMLNYSVFGNRSSFLYIGGRILL